MRHLLTLCLSFLMVVGFLPTAALAAPTTAEERTPPTAAEPAAPDEATTSENADQAADAVIDAATTIAVGHDAATPTEPEGTNPDQEGTDSDPEGAEPDPNAATVEAQVSSDETTITVTAKGGEFATAKSVTFNTWSNSGGKDDFVAHGAIQREDGSWTATIFIAGNPAVLPGVPYNGRIPNAVHRAYNPYNGEHLYTADTNEADTLCRNGWNYEGVAWVTPEQATERVYRLFNPSTGEHLYTVDMNEYRVLGGSGWTQEGVKLYSDPDKGMAIYRLQNPQLDSGSHLYTIDPNEYEGLGNQGWIKEGIKFYGAATNADGTWSETGWARTHQTPGDYTIEAYAVPRTDDPVDDEAPGEDADNPADQPAAGDKAPATDPDKDKTGGTDDPADKGTTGDTPNEGTTDGDVSGEDTDNPVAPEPEPVPDPDPVLIATTSFTISKPRAQAWVENVNNAKGTFDIVVSGIDSPSGVARVHVPTWNSEGNQSDICWYEAQPRSNGVYQATAYASDHDLALHYLTHIYVTAGNGVRVSTGSVRTDLTLANYMRVTGGPYDYTVGLYNPGPVGEVTIGAWSSADGKDDIHWYNATDQGNGWWNATVRASFLKASGQVDVDGFANGEYRNSTSFWVQPWEILEQKYRTMNEKVNDLASPTNYLIAIDNTRCFIGIYTGSRGQWTNISYWPCAPGTAWTPTVRGLFSIGSRGYVFGSGFSCYYWTQFYGDYLFHSIKYNQGTFVVQDGTMGRPASHGCVRLWIENAKWIHDNIPSRTTVLSY